MTMSVTEIADLLEAEVLTPELELSGEVVHGFSSDLMSDVLTGEYYKTVLVTGLSNLQAIRTAEMSDISLVIIARNKSVKEDMIGLARELGIVLLKSRYSMFRVSGMLYEAGIKPHF
jgi:predicted transcriptional regulator